ncbi:non-hydrolyzing UDP-N-acetylglucosamine 2-epimerase [Streptomyces sp. XD-27]|uniref:non-hydrolyzing UDP-N-acetylglucosamine 2-epimerase n=1 Tax=Streptomyces sp. XD-27 TaxID=3062779 RepID=UPI0026F45C5E|nr:UDP-N-acetylglucosamine 2-epimerase (non-hydrolyzing) [Streptomyces sp. XD-27]WKX69378.1 UDP-N-acetylglucosamine 2-epimerase (non-hydrolyzing) [Streptomyces sp. XD-27]
MNGTGSARRIALVVGTRPEAVKLAPLILELRRCAWSRPMVITTGQHGPVVRETLSCFGIGPDVTLSAPRGADSVTELTAGLLSTLGPQLRRPGTHAVVVQGDTSSALAGAMAGFFSSVPVVHVEAGLRSGDLRTPFPEEAHRRMISEVCDLHLAPTHTALKNLLAEGISAERILVTGNTVVDAVVTASQRTADSRDILPGDTTSPLVLVTAHRRENWGKPIRRIGEAVAEISRRHPRTTFVVAAHMNPAVRAEIEDSLHGLPNMRLPGPVPYGTFARILARSALAITDSGGIQEEAIALGVPVLVTRDTTERVEGISSGLARLVGTHGPDIVAAADRELARARPLPLGVRLRAVVRGTPYGDGRAAARCAAACGWLLGECPRPRGLPER